MALMERAGDRAGVAASLRGCAVVYMQAGDARSARPYILQARAVGHAAGDRHGDVWSEYKLGWAATLIGNYPEARAQFLAARAGFEEQGASFGAYACTVWLADVSRLEGHWRAALGSYREALDRIRTHHFTVHGVDFLEGLALSAAALSRLDASARLFAAAATWFDTRGAEIRTSLDRDACDQAINHVCVRLGEAAWEGCMPRDDGLAPRRRFSWRRR